MRGRKEMEVVYYRTTTGRCPARESIEKITTSQRKDRETKTLAIIDAVVKNVADNKGVVGGGFSSPLAGREFQELRISIGAKLLRILYFPFQEEKLILLSAYDKPKLYEKGLKKKVDRDIDRVHELTQTYYDDFLKNPDHYEKYEE